MVRKKVGEIILSIEIARNALNDDTDLLGFTTKETKYLSLSGYINGLQFTLGKCELINSLCEKRIMDARPSLSPDRQNKVNKSG